MSKNTKNGPATRESQSHNANLIIDAVEQALAKMDLRPLLEPAARRTVIGVVRRTPDALCEAVCSLADRNSGHVLSVAIDSSTIRQTIAYAVAYERVPAMLRAAAQRIDDDIVQRRFESIGAARTAFGALELAQRAPEGKALRPEYLEMRAIVVATHKRRGKGKAASQPVTPPAAAANTNASTAPTGSPAAGTPPVSPATPPPAAPNTPPAANAPASTAAA